MSSTPTPLIVGRGEAADVPAAQRLNEWRTRLDAFADAFNAEISQILTTLADLPLEAARSLPLEAVRDVPPVPVGGQTMEFTLPPAAPVAAPQPVAAVRTAAVNAPPQTSRPAASAAPVAIPPAATPRPASSAPTPSQPAAAPTEPNRLAALKARLSQQMASAGHSQPAGVGSTEGSRS